MSGCSYHASRESVGACVNCGKLVCATCHNEVDGKSYCPVCVDKLFAVKEAETKSVSLKQETSVPVAAIKESPPEPKEAVSILSAKTGVVAPPAAKTVVAVPAKSPEGPAGVNPLWWVAVVIGGWVGGLLAWLLNKDKQPTISKYMLFGGIGWSALQAFVAIIVVFSLIIGPAIGTHPQAIKPAAPNAGVSSPSASGKTKPPAQGSPTISAANTGQAEETIEIKPPAPKPPPAPTYTTSPLVVQDLRPSDQDQTVKYADNLTVIVPGGGLKQANKLTISSVSDAPEWKYLHRQDIGTYDISFDSQHTFDKPLTFEFAYDSSQLPAGLTPEEALTVSYLDSDGKTWIDVPVSIDQQRQKVIVGSLHTSLWRYAMGTLSGTVEHYLWDIFDVAYFPVDFINAFTKQDDDEITALKQKRATTALTPDETARLAALTQRRLIILQTAPNQMNNPLGAFKGCLNINYEDDYPAIPRYVIDTAVHLAQAHNAYEIFGKRWHPLLVVIDPVNEIYSSHNGWNDHIEVNANTNCDERGLGVTLAHELFHAMQSIDYYPWVRNIGGLAPVGIPAGHWWFESTADYAAFKIAMQYAKANYLDVTEDFLREDFFSRGNPDENHPYKISYFWDYLQEKQNIQFVPMYNAVAASYNLNTRNVLDQYLRNNSQNNFGLTDWYHEWVKRLIFDESGPYVDPLHYGNRLLTTNLQTLAIQLGAGVTDPGMTTCYEGIYPSVDSDIGTRRLDFKLAGMRGDPAGLPDFWISICKLNKNERKWDNMEVVATFHGTGFYLLPREIGYVDLGPEDAVYIVVSGYQWLQYTYLITATDQAVIGVKGPDSSVLVNDKGTIGEPYSFRAVSKQIPSTATYTWYVDGKALDGGGSVLDSYKFWGPGEHSISVSASLGQGAPITSNVYKFNIGSPVISVKSTLPAGNKGVPGTPYDFSQESTYVPGDAKYSWTAGNKKTDKGKDGATYVFNGPGKYEVGVKAEWPVPGGDSGHVNGSLIIEVGQAELQISAIPVPGVVGQASSFSLTGGSDALVANFNWDFGNNEGGMGTEKPDAKATHTYQQAGTYTVTATAVDRKTGKSLGTATLKYRVYIMTLNVPAEVKAGKGVVGNKYDFSITTDVPDGAEYVWYSNGQVVIRGTDKKSTTASFAKARDYTMKVEVEWQDENGQSQTISSDPVTFQIKEPPGSITIVPPPDILAGKGVMNTKYLFTVESENIPNAAKISWYSDDVLRATGGQGFFTFIHAKPYTLRVRAVWTDSNGVQQSADDTSTFDIAAGEPPQEGSISIVPPPDIAAGKGVIKSKYIFTVDSVNVPDSAEYVWYSNGQVVTSGTDKKSTTASFAKARDYTMKVEANWTDSSGNQQTAISKEVSFNINDTSSQQGSGGEGVICLFTADKPSMGDVIGISIFQNGRTVIDNQTGTEGLGSNKFKLTPGHYTVKVAGRCGYLLPFAGNTKDAFTYDPPKTTSCEIDVVGGSSTAEFHYPWSCP